MKDLRKNQAQLEHKNHRFTIWQDQKEYWWFQYGKLKDINTHQKELQIALNQIYETIREQEERIPRRVFVPRKGVAEGSK